jgi:RNA polymerase sigma factor (sigma-70 family)
MSAELHDIAEVYEERFAEFLRVATAIVGDGERARDAVQDAFAGAVRSRRTYRGDGSLVAWLWMAVVNSARRESARKIPPPVAGAEAQASNGRIGDPDRSIRAALATLPERQRVTLFLRYYADLDYNAIAEALSVKPGTVAATLNAAHANVRRLLQEVPQ